MSKNIILIGYRGTGKTFVGSHLAEKLGYKFIDTDDVIEQRAGMKIADIVNKYDWEYFRDCESEVLLEVCSGEKSVIATGGGVIEREQNRRAMKKNGIVIWLIAPPDIIYERIKNDSNRPNLTDAKTEKEDILKKLPERIPIYRSMADFTIETHIASLSETVHRILHFLYKKKNI
jgi:shikimate kinase